MSGLGRLRRLGPAMRREPARDDQTGGDQRHRLGDEGIDPVAPAIMVEDGRAEKFPDREAEREADDDPPNWELILPGGVLLEFGPGARWQISSAGS